MDKEKPKWTVHYSILSPRSPWIGSGWDFFDFEPPARLRRREIYAQGNHGVVIRSFHEETDTAHMAPFRRIHL